jgi:predicted enzyme related to lactoylglutathione lyase
VTRSEDSAAQHFPAHGSVGYLQLPALDVARSAAFYAAVFGWVVDATHGGFEARGLVGQLTNDVTVASSGGPLLWLTADRLWRTLELVADNGGAVRGRPWLDGGERWLVEVDDPAGNRLGLAVRGGRPQSQTMIMVRDVEASSRWYTQLLGLRSDHGGVEYERLTSGGVLVLQLHHREVDHHHGPIGDAEAPVGNGVLLWFGEVVDFDAVVGRAAGLGVTVVKAPHRNPPEGQGNGPSHRELWVLDPDGYTVVVASSDGEDYEP